MDSSKRLFTGIPVPAGEMFLDFFHEMQRGFSLSKIKWIPPENFHITLHFFGETPSEKIEELSDEFSRSLRDQDPFRCRLTGLGIFKNIRKPKVIWCGFDPAEPFQEIYHRLLSLYDVVRKPSPSRSFSPHLTIGRIKWLHDRELLGRWIEKYDGFLFYTFTVTDVVLYESILKPSGPEYKVIRKVVLAAQ